MDDVISEEDLEDIIKDLNVENGDKKVNSDASFDSSNETPDKVNMEETKATQSLSSKETSSNDLSCLQRFEHMKKEYSNTSRCSTSFARYIKKDIKGISLIHEMTRLIKVGGSLGYDVRGCRKSLKQMINGIGVHIVDK